MSLPKKKKAFKRLVGEAAKVDGERSGFQVSGVSRCVALLQVI